MAEPDTYERLRKQTEERIQADKAMNERILNILKQKEAPLPPLDLLKPPVKKNAWQELDEHSKKLIAGEKGLQAQKNILGAPFHIIDKLMSHGYSPGTEDTQGVQNAADISLMLMGTGAAAPKPSGTLGMSGGKPPTPRLNTESHGEIINSLQKHAPAVDENWVRNWAKEAGVPVDHVLGEDTKYLKLKPNNPPSPGVNDHLVVRLPQDDIKHIGTNILPPRRNALMDTGIGVGSTSQPSKLGRVESSLVNESGMPYAHPEAADAWLKYNTQKAPGGGNWLIPEELKPRPYVKPVHEPQGPKIPENWSPNQLKLLSGGYTPADILQILKQQGQSQNGPPQ